jgi:uncharacterized protein (TIGR04141 family)
MPLVSGVTSDVKTLYRQRVYRVLHHTRDPDEGGDRRAGPMPSPKTRVTTVYRLPGVAPDRDAMFDALTATVGSQELDSRHADIRLLTLADCPALWVTIQSDPHKPGWCAAASVTTGLDIQCMSSSASALLMIAVDGVTYALSFGHGHHLIKEELRDPRFGLQFATRRVDPLDIQNLVRRRPGARGRLDTTLIPGGLPIWALGVSGHAEIIRRLGGTAPGDGFTFSASDNRCVRVHGSVALTMPIGLEAQHLVADLREIARVCTYEEPPSELAFVEYIQPIPKGRTRDELWDRLDDLLGRFVSDSDDSVCPVVPTDSLEEYTQARAFVVTIGRPADPVPHLTEDHILARVRRYRPGRRITALRSGRVVMYADEACRERLDSTSTAKWIEASVSLDSQRYFLLDGDWYQIDAEYARIKRDEIVSLFTSAPTLDLPPWRRGIDRDEAEYNLSVPNRVDGYLCFDLDRRVRHPLGARSPLEVCDLLGPNDEQIYVKHAEGSAPLSHLFFQGLVAVESELNSSDVRAKFSARVAETGHGRTIPPDFTPKKVVFAILLKKGKELTPDTLFPFSQVTLAETARILRSYGVDVEVIGIRGAEDGE